VSKREERFNVFLLKEGRAVSRSNKFLFSLLFFLLIPISIFSKVIITHGVLGNDSDWYKPGGYFYEAVSESAKKLDQSVDTFSWTQDLGGITHYERIKAGIKLAKQIVDNKVAGEKEIILIGHSYGGHVIKVASQLLSFAQIPSFSEEQQEPEEVVSQEIEEIVPEEKIDETEEALEEILTEEEIFEDLERDLEFLETDEFFEMACFEVQKYKEDKLKGRIKDEFLIDAVYTLGTPNDIPDYIADMNVINHLYNFYSKGDLVQDMVGDHLLPFPKHERAVNLRVEMKKDGWWCFWNWPTHTQMHAEAIGKWLLAIPFGFMNEGMGNFDKFTFACDGMIKFEKDKLPLYQVSVAGDKEDGIFSKYDFSWLLSKFKILGHIC